MSWTPKPLNAIRRTRPSSVDRARARVAVALIAAALGCPQSDGESKLPPRAATPSGLRPGGEATFTLGPQPSFIQPAANLASADKPRFYAGKALATQPWVRAPSSTDARDGLGPIYNARSCLACHVRGGRGRAAQPNVPVFTTLVRLSVPGQGPHGEPKADPTYGTQLQPQSTSLAHQLGVHDDGGGAPPEAEVRIRWTSSEFTYPDGTMLALQSPTLELDAFGYGPLDATTRTGLRHTPSLAGVGLLAGVDPEDVERLADPEDENDDGISGRVNHVWDSQAHALRPGRFGLKANMPSLRVQVAGALHGDMGLSNPVFPGQPCSAQQPRCLAEPHGGAIEVPEPLLASMAFFVASIGVPARRRADDPLVLEGQALFAATGCDDCHTPHFHTVDDDELPHLSRQDIWPYTDLLLHDMGPELADGRSDYEATGREWRTQPLWGVGLARAVVQHVGLLHDGRARTVEEAIVWHGGEARASRDRFAALRVDERRAVLAFVRSL